MPIPRTAAFAMADRLADGQLATLLVDLRNDGQSWASITKVLHADHGIHVGADTVADWHRQLTADSDNGEQVAQ